MKYILTGSTGHISKPLAQQLVAEGHDVTIISSKSERRKDIENLGAEAAIGSVEDIDFLASTFSGAEAVYTMIPPNYSVKHWKKHIAMVGQKYADAIGKSRVPYVVNLSSIGAHLPEGCGPVNGIHLAEKALNDLPETHVLHLRAGFFYYNFYASIGMIKQMGIIGGNYGAGTKLILAHTNDIAEVAAQELLHLRFKEKSFRYVVSDEKTTNDIAKELGASVGKPDLKWVDFTDEQNERGMVEAGLSEEHARNYTEMGAAIRNGTMFADYEKQKAPLAGKIRLSDFAKEFGLVYNG
jgi:uncharacterized protein YbjT (DUF2867 family)